VITTVLDDIDLIIIGELADEGRMPFRTLAEKIGLSANATGARVARLLENGTISVHAHIHPESLGRPIEAMIDCRLRKPDETDVFDAAIAEDARVEEAVFVTGAFDYVLRVHVATTADLDNLLILLRAKGAAETNTRLIMRRYGDRGVPLAALGRT
jgi:Lrp/AsnC family transcriptional regulator, leucine-responsive regulatory protein